MNKMDKIDILSRAFDTNKSVNYVIKQDSKREKRIRSLVQYSYDKTIKAGRVFLIEGKAVALVYSPQNIKTNIFADLKLVFTALGFANIRKALGFKSKVKKNYPNKMLYIDLLGVDPQFQGQGYGSQLLDEIKAYANKEKMPLYLETSTLKNIAFYKRNGFEQYGSIQFEFELFLFRYVQEKVQ